MTGFLIALIAACLMGFVTRDRVLMAELYSAAGRRGALLMTAVATASVAMMIAARLGWAAASLATGHGRLLLTFLALGIAGAELLRPVRVRPLREPTNSLGAAAFVLLAYQIADASRLLMFAIALSWPGLAVAAGGALGSAAVLAIGWHGDGRYLAVMPHLRRAFGAILILAGAMLLIAASHADRFWQSLTASI